MPITGSDRCQDLSVWFERYQSAVPNSRGTHPGIFALANGLARAGRLSAADWAWWRASNDALDRAYIDPAKVDPTVFDRTLHPWVSCWFKESATHLHEPVMGYLTLLDRYSVMWIRLQSNEPGFVLYEDDDQVVVVPRAD